MNKQDFINTKRMFLTFCSYVNARYCPKDLRNIVEFKKPDSSQALDSYRWIPIKLAGALRKIDGEYREYETIGLNEDDISFIIDERNYYAHPKNFSPNFRLSIKETVQKMWECLKKMNSYFG